MRRESGGLMEGLAWNKRLGLSNVIFELDAKGVQYVSRQANIVAHALALRASSSFASPTLWVEPPNFVVAHLEDICQNRATELDISEMGFIGKIPPEIGNLSSLVSLNIMGNYFHGQIPSSIFNMSSLEIISMMNNNLSGRLPVDICSLGRLKVLDLSMNMFYGEIPSSLEKCSKLEMISLFENNLGGHVPREIGNITGLTSLFLGFNNLEGNIPEELGDLNKLSMLSMPYNKLTGPLPPNIFNMSSLAIIDLQNNNLSGRLPLSSNKFSGALPREIGNMTSVQVLYLNNNALRGSIPRGIGKLNNLIGLDLSHNQISGKIPSSICKLRSLRYFHLSNNSLEGSIPKCLSNLSKSLRVLHLRQNDLNGLIPTTFAKGCLLESLNLNGTLPQSLVNCERLQVLDVGNNEIRDTFPFWIETLPELRVLVLRSNRFNGTISLSLPSKTNKLPSLFPKLQVFDISQNAFSGSLPSTYLESFRGMINAKENRTEKSRNWFSYYEETMVFVLKGLELPVDRILTMFTTIDLSENKFSGSILQSIGNLNSLKYLNLSHNSLAGNIPSSLGNVTALESLDLSSNRLVGQIPWQLTRLTFLSKLNLSMNDLVGQIPQSSGQFSTFDNSSYMENSGLCGFPLTKKCKEENALPMFPQESDDDDDSDFLDGFSWQVVLLGYGCGFAFGIVMGCLIFRYERTKRLMGFFLGVKHKTRRRSRGNVVRRRT
ncbi:hypothetical protein DH2020_021485 [Rehmannia glutinosa]|uniref:Uncharacterized protein n=1 Tax=Rehmannia glutinosa TaxID=99300 RepID=A0ABR0WC12_REHGL